MTGGIKHIFWFSQFEQIIGGNTKQQQDSSQFLNDEL
jgi:hypothetical protein